MVMLPASTSNLTNYNMDIHTISNLYINGLKEIFSHQILRKHYIHFLTKHIPVIHMKTGYGNKLIPHILHTKFPGINIDSTLSWRMHIEQPVYKLDIYISKPYMSHITLIMIHYSYFHSIMN